jgi:prophage regulatory protein
MKFILMSGIARRVGVHERTVRNYLAAGLLRTERLPNGVHLFLRKIFNGSARSGRRVRRGAREGGLMTSRLLRLPEVEARCGLKRSVIYKMARQGQFPPPIKLVGRSSAWVEAEIQGWIDDRIRANRDSSATTTQAGDEHRVS